jgi:hypothetical protein
LTSLEMSGFYQIPNVSTACSVLIWFFVNKMHFVMEISWLNQMQYLYGIVIRQMLQYIEEA